MGVQIAAVATNLACHPAIRSRQCEAKDLRASYKARVIERDVAELRKEITRTNQWAPFRQSLQRICETESLNIDLFWLLRRP